MPRFFEVNTDTDVLCYIPSGKVTDTGQQEIQFMQEGDTCWFYATKRLANATGFQLEDPIFEIWCLSCMPPIIPPNPQQY